MSKLPEQSELGDMQGHVQMPTIPSTMPTQPSAESWRQAVAEYGRETGAVITIIRGDQEKVGVIEAATRRTSRKFDPTKATARNVSAEYWIRERAIEIEATKSPSVAGTSAEDAVRALVRPIERDEDYDRTYIPLPGGWEVQTKGRGSPFRIVGPDKFRLLIEDRPYLHETLERMARDIHDAFTAAQSRAQGGVDSGGVG